MPNLRPLDMLRRSLADAMALPQPMRDERVWAHDQQMVASRKAVETTFNGLSATPPTATIQAAVNAFARTATAPASFTSLKHVCYGLTLPADQTGGQLLIQTPSAITRLLRAVDGRRQEARQFRRCYQALLQSYFVYDKPGDPQEARTAAQKAGDIGFAQLRVYLQDNLALIAKPTGSGPTPAWTLALVDNANLLTEQPCDKYLDELRRGQTKTLQDVCNALGISSASWVWQEVVLAYVRELCGRPDDAFATRMSTALDIADRRTDLRPSAVVARRVVSALSVRYSKSQVHPEHPRLRDMAVEHIGNPWLKRPAWDAFVAHEPARQMVDHWLKGRLIRDFFELLSHDGSADQRRLDYWLRFESVIDDMWFVLGYDARMNKSLEFLEVKKRMDGRLRALSGSPQNENNAFVLKIGKTVVIEFGVTGNACYVFDETDFLCDLDQDTLAMSALKQKRHATRLSHMVSWETRFDDEICPRIGFWPPNAKRPPPRPAPTQQRFNLENGTQNKAAPPAGPSPEVIDYLIRTCTQLGLVVQDNRPKGGTLWFLTGVPVRAPIISMALQQSNFEFKPGKGYWLKDH